MKKQDENSLSQVKRTAMLFKDRLLKSQKKAKALDVNADFCYR